MIVAALMNPETLPDAEPAIARLRRGDTDAVGELLARYQHRLFRFLMRLVRDRAEAEDLFQQTWIRVMEKISRYDSRAGFDVWLLSVAHNLAIDHLRRQRGTSLDAPEEGGITPADRLAARGPNPLEQLLDSERGAILEAAILRLPVIHRVVVSLRFEEGMKLEEIADVAGVPLPTVKSRLHRALENLRAAVEAIYERA